jgi:hypothetical protein
MMYFKDETGSKIVLFSMLPTLILADQINSFTFAVAFSGS